MSVDTCGLNCASVCTAKNRCDTCKEGFIGENCGTPIRICRANEYEVSPLSTTINRVCASLTTCSGSEYEVVAPTATSNRMCAQGIPTCLDGEYYDLDYEYCNTVSDCDCPSFETAAPTPTSDRQCHIYPVCPSCIFGIDTNDCWLDVTDLATCEVYVDRSVRYSGATSLSVPNFVSASNGFHVGPEYSLTQLLLPKFKCTGNNGFALSYTAVTHLSLPELSQVRGWFAITTNSQLTFLDVPKLTYIKDQIYVSGNHRNFPLPSSPLSGGPPGGLHSVNWSGQQVCQYYAGSNDPSANNICP